MTDVERPPSLPLTVADRERLACGRCGETACGSVLDVTLWDGPTERLAECERPAGHDGRHAAADSETGRRWLRW